MSNVKAVGDRKRGAVRPKSEMANIRISEPFNFRHDFHVPPEDVDTRSVDGSLSPPPPCPGSKDGSCAELSIPDEAQTDTLLQLLKGEIIPALHIEIGDIIERKLQKVIDQLLPAIKEGNRHCPRCTRAHSDSVSYSSLESHSADKYVNVPTAHQAVANTYVTEPNIPDTATQRLERNPDDAETERLTNRRPVYNPIYPISGGDTSTLYLPVHTKAGTLVKYGSEIHLVPTAQTATQGQQNQSLQRSNTLPIGQGLHHTNGHHRMSGRSGMSRDKPDERECLAKALQMNVIELVNDVIFKDSELPDTLLADGCLTENESIRCRKYKDPRDQVRLLLCIIKGRDLDVLKRFLKQIKAHNESVAQKIEAQFEQNKKQGMRSKTCALCKLAERVDLKYIADSLYKHSLVDDGLYNIIFQTDLPTGAQGEIWHKVIACLNAKCAENASIVKSVLTEALAHKNHYNQLAKEIQWMISNQNEISCRCQVKFIIPPGDSILSVVSSRSPPTSISDVCEEVKTDHAHDIDETGEEATTPVQKDSEQIVTDGLRPVTSSDVSDEVSMELEDDDALTPKNAEMTFKEVEVPAPKPDTISKHVGAQDYGRLVDSYSTKQKNKPRTRNNATSDVITSNELVENKVSKEVDAAASNTQHTPRYKLEVAQRRAILIPSDLQSSNV